MERNWKCWIYIKIFSVWSRRIWRDQQVLRCPNQRRSICASCFTVFNFLLHSFQYSDNWVSKETLTKLHWCTKRISRELSNSFSLRVDLVLSPSRDGEHRVISSQDIMIIDKIRDTAPTNRIHHTEAVNNSVARTNSRRTMQHLLRAMDNMEAFNSKIMEGTHHRILNMLRDIHPQLDTDSQDFMGVNRDTERHPKLSGDTSKDIRHNTSSILLKEEDITSSMAEDESLYNQKVHSLQLVMKRNKS
mmetsp:Transcript_10320/g.38309  ORF Transcript_10320/g.38309 Transcript_10320/m.38309 type:complete len:246 (+) Transcript_10320:2564-3301(+)